MAGSLKKVSLDPKYSLGTPQEIANRDNHTYQPPGKAFRQISSGPGGNAAEPRQASKSGNFKFSNGV